MSNELLIQEEIVSTPTDINDPSKVYYLYTPEAKDADNNSIAKKYRKMFRIPGRSTIALMKVGSVVRYGVTTCSVDNNFCKTEGRKRADQRLIENFGMFTIPSDFLERNPNIKDNEQICLFFLTKIAKSIMFNPKKYAKRIREHNAKQESYSAVLNIAKEA